MVDEKHVKVRFLYGIINISYELYLKNTFFIINTVNINKKGITIELRSFETEEPFLAYNTKETFSKETLRQAK